MGLLKRLGNITNVVNALEFRRDNCRAGLTHRKYSAIRLMIGSLIAAHASSPRHAAGVKTSGRNKKMTDIIAQTKRLQSAVREMLYELNIYQQQENCLRVRKEALDTIETYGLEPEDME